MLVHTLKRFESCAEVDEVLPLVPAGEILACEDAVRRAGLKKVLRVLAGGAERQDSVYAGLQAVKGEARWVLIHDGARPFVPQPLIRAVLDAARQCRAAVAALPAGETIKEVSPRREVVQTLDRRSLWLIQTPQVFAYDLILEAHEEARRVGFQGTDDASLIERLGVAVCVVEGSRLNLKITTPEDLLLAEALLKCRDQGSGFGDQQRPVLFRTLTPDPRSPGCIGFGYDVHRLVPGRKLILGGVEIPHDRGLEGHSDADVLLHALCDGILGALGEGDIGRHFPNTDAAYRGISSLELLAAVAARMIGQGFCVNNVDSTVVAERPKIGPYIPEMREKIAAVLGLPPQRVNVKATTSEGLGFPGEGKGISASAVVLLVKKG